MTVYLRSLEDLLDAVHRGTLHVEGKRWDTPRVLRLLEDLRSGYPIGCFTVELPPPEVRRVSSRETLIDGRARMLSLAWALGRESPLAFDVEAGEFVDGVTSSTCLPLADIRASALLDFLRRLDPDARRHYATPVNVVGKMLFAELPVYYVLARPDTLMRGPRIQDPPPPPTAES